MKKYNLVLVIFVLLAALLLAFCKKETDTKSDRLEGTSWVLYAYRKSKPIPGTTITANFENGQVRGSDVFNTFSGSYHLEGGKISIDNLAITLMACLEPEGIMEQEQMILEYFGDAQTFQLSDEQLMIFRSDGEALTFVLAE